MRRSSSRSTPSSARTSKVRQPQSSKAGIAPGLFVFGPALHPSSTSGIGTRNNEAQMAHSRLSACPEDLSRVARDRRCALCHGVEPGSSTRTAPMCCSRRSIQARRSRACSPLAMPVSAGRLVPRQSQAGRGARTAGQFGQRQCLHRHEGQAHGRGVGALCGQGAWRRARDDLSRLDRRDRRAARSGEICRRHRARCRAGSAPGRGWTPPRRS